MNAIAAAFVGDARFKVDAKCSVRSDLHSVDLGGEPSRVRVAGTEGKHDRCEKEPPHDVCPVQLKYCSNLLGCT